LKASRLRTTSSTADPVAAIALMAATFIAYYPAWHGGVLWDDNAHLTRPDLQSAAGLWRIWFDVGATQQYYPVTHSGFWLMHRLWGDATIGYHFVNLGLHAASALLVARILRRLAVPGALLAATLFALHPVHVESVAWMAELKNTLSGVCYLAAALAYLRFDERRDWTAYAAAFALFLAALLTKSVTGVLPGALLVVLWWQRGALTWRGDVRPLLPFFAAAAAAAVMTSWFEGALNGARGAEFHLGAVERVLIAGRAVWFYLATLAWPSHLSFIYPRWEVDRTAWWQYVYPLGVMALVAACWLYRRRSRAPLAAILIFCGTLVPALGFVDVYPFRYSFVADHFQYLASIPIMALAAAAAVTALTRLRAGSRSTERALCVAFGVPLALLTSYQSRQYVDETTLYRATLARNPSCWMCHNNLATRKLYGSAADLDEAVAHLQESLRLNPADAEAHNNMGGALQRMGRYEDAIAEHAAALRLNPMLVEARYNIGVCDQALGRLNEAHEQYSEAIRAQPDYTMAHYNLATISMAMGRPAEAEAQLREALRLNPALALAHDALGIVLLQAGRIPDAVTEFRNATLLQPDYAPAHYKLAVTLAGAGMTEEALPEFRDAARYAPGSPEIHHDLGAAFANLGRLDEAAAEFREALRLRPEYAEARAHLEQVTRRMR
jgi:tetratricopeptide (TPR) repeat protein